MKWATDRATDRRPLIVDRAPHLATRAMRLASRAIDRVPSASPRRARATRRRRAPRAGLSGFGDATRSESAKTKAKTKTTILGDAASSVDVKDAYEFGAELGRGQFGEVRAVTDKESGRALACKSISKRGLSSERSKEMVRNEVKIMHHLNGNAKVVELVATHEDATHVHLVMEKLDGDEWFDAMAEQFETAPYSEAEAAAQFRNVAHTVEYCHIMDVMHRDLKPENFVLKSGAKDSPVCAIDFGLSTFATRDQVFTDFVGSPYYVAPEVMAYKYSNGADVWSCGVILYILLSGVPPFWGSSEKQVFDAIKRYKTGAEPLDLVSEPWPSVSDAAKELIQGMLTVDPTKRMTIEDVLQHPWLADPSVAPKTALDNIVYKRFKNFAAMSKFKKLGLHAMARAMPAEEIAGLSVMFKELDKDKSGTVSIDELREGLKLQSSDAAAELEEVFKVVDLDGTGELHWEEFIVATLARSKRESKAAIQRAFDYFDTDHDGSLTAEEFQSALDTMSPVERANLGDVTELIATADANGDGVIDFEEFMTAMSADSSAR